MKKNFFLTVFILFLCLLFVEGCDEDVEEELKTTNSTTGTTTNTTTGTTTGTITGTTTGTITGTITGTTTGTAIGTTTGTFGNEPYAKYAWHVGSLESSIATPYKINTSSHINLKAAWGITKGTGIKIAVIDNMFDVEHEDLKSNIIKTYNADNESSNIANTSNESSHGTTCAGFAASPINGKGLAGAAPEAQLILIALTSADDATTIKAFEYAKAQGARVVSCSWGTFSPDNNSSFSSQAVESKIKELYDAGIVILFASGNDGYNLDTTGANDESELEWVIGVGASSEANDVTSYSSYGSNIDVLAPGGDTEASLGILGLDDTGILGSTLQRNFVTNNYAFTNGTSFSCPLAAGVVALILSVKPSLTPAQVRAILIETADKIGTTSGAVYNANGFDTKRAYGKINAYNAVVKAQQSQ